MTVLALLTDAFGGHGGIAQYNRDLIDAMASSQRVTQIEVLPRQGQADNAELPSKVQQHRPRSGRLAYTAAALAISASRRFDVVFCGHLYLGPVAALIARGSGAKLIAQAHGVEVWNVPNATRRWAYEAADFFLCVSRHTRARLLDWAAVPPERAIVLPNTVALDYHPGDAGALRGRLGLKDKKVLLSVGRLDARERYKGHDQIINLLPMLHQAGHDVTYVIVGQGNDRCRLESLAAKAGVSDEVRFLGYISREELPDHYRMADLFVLPSTGEGFGIAFLEAMACGTAALGLDVGGARDALGDGELGVTTSEHGLLNRLLESFASPRPNGTALASQVQGRFGRARFQARVDSFMVDIERQASLRNTLRLSTSVGA